jgi:CheY-like chemotaxis protein
MRILIAEDDPTLALAAKHAAPGGVCRRLGHGWRRGGSRLGTGSDLLILDIRLPALRARRAEAIAHATRLPVLLLTALDSVDDRVRGLDAAPTTISPAVSTEAERARASTRRGMSGAPTLIRHGPCASTGSESQLGGERLTCPHVN